MSFPFYRPDPARASRFLFFTGKVGLGETSLSCATAWLQWRLEELSGPDGLALRASTRLETASL